MLSNTTSEYDGPEPICENDFPVKSLRAKKQGRENRYAPKSTPRPFRGLGGLVVYTTGHNPPEEVGPGSNSAGARFTWAWPHRETSIRGLRTGCSLHQPGEIPGGSPTSVGFAFLPPTRPYLTGPAERGGGDVISSPPSPKLA